MGLLASLKRAEDQGRKVSRRADGDAGDLWEDAERRLRRKMRIHPRPSPAALRVTSSTAVTTGGGVRQPT